MTPRHRGPSSGIVDRERATVEAHTSLPEQDWRPVLDPDGQRRTNDHGTQQDQSHGCPDDVDNRLTINPSSRRSSRMYDRTRKPSNSSWYELARQIGDRVERDPDGLALVGREPAERLEVVSSARRETDRDLIDDSRMEDRPGHREAAEDRPRDQLLRLAGIDTWPTTLIPSAGRPSTRSAKLWARSPVPATSMKRVLKPSSPKRTERQAKRDPTDQRDQRLGHEQQDQEQTADGVPWEEEQRRQRERQHQRVARAMSLASVKSRQRTRSR